MDHCGTWSGGRRAWLTLVLRFCILQGTSPRNASCARPEARFVVGGGVHGVGGVANDRSALVFCATTADQQQGSCTLLALVALVTVLTIDLYWFCMLQRRRGRWRRPSSSMASCGWPAARFVLIAGVGGVGDGAND
ncbi:hypothetical protein PF006_g27633 [Phytophthora fragariae]|uniref:Uncharacterized protein n=1 Tax=Phytophthora fragariae TaxID=53985 RepID=A0A6A3QLF0_9STRA|nr:hypothetical protein PF003_g5110 [Phytophthora fragariae]KAE9078850.1 hypothetical protein PF006_g27633 [Phytophthora fragariae]